MFGEPYVPPVSDGSGSDRALLKRANEMLLAAGCTRDGGVLKLPSGKPFVDRVPRLVRRPPAAHRALPAEPAQARHRRAVAHRRRRAIQEPHRKFRLRRRDGGVRRQPRRRAPSCALFLSAKAATMEGSRNLSGVADPVVDALIEKIVHAATRDELNLSLPRARPRAARRALLGADVVQRLGLGRLLGRLLASRDSAQARRRRARHLVVGRRQGEENWALERKWRRGPLASGRMGETLPACGRRWRAAPDAPAVVDSADRPDARPCSPTSFAACC